MVSVRIFVAVSVNVTQELTALRQELSQLPAPIRMTHPEDLHMTLKFIGDTSPAAIPRIWEIVDETAADFGPLNIDLVGLHTFGRPQQAEVLWVGIEPSQQIVSIASRLDHQLSTIGIAAETRTFQPHVTVARLPSRSTSDPESPTSTISTLLTANSTTRYGTTTVGTVSLFASDFGASTKNAGPLYTEVER